MQDPKLFKLEEPRMPVYHVNGFEPCQCQSQRMPEPESQSQKCQEQETEWTHHKTKDKTRQESILFWNFRVSWAYPRPDGSPILWAMAEEVAKQEDRVLDYYLSYIILRGWRNKQGWRVMETLFIYFNFILSNQFQSTKANHNNYHKKDCLPHPSECRKQASKEAESGPCSDNK